MAEITIYSAEDDITLDAGEALGFFGPDGFGDPISLNQYNGRTFITTPSGTTEYEECDNCKYLDASGVILGQTGSGISLLKLPNYQATMNIRFTHSENVITQNAKLTIYQGDSSLPTSGIDVMAAEIIHTSRVQDATGAGDSAWIAMSGDTSPLYLVNSPGTSGYSPSGPATEDIRHDWYVAMTVKPTLPGDKNFNMKVDLEYI